MLLPLAQVYSPLAEMKEKIPVSNTRPLLDVINSHVQGHSGSSSVMMHLFYFGVSGTVHAVHLVHNKFYMFFQ